MKLMRVRITLGRIVALVVLCALASIALTIAFAHGDSSKSKRKAKVTAPPTKTVPGVVNQPYVFAESTLQQQGFGWKVVGPVAGLEPITRPGNEGHGHGRSARYLAAEQAEGPRHSGHT